MFVWISPEGALRFLYDDRLRGLLALGAAELRRASHVEPTPDGQWTADLGPSGGPILGPFPLRQEALEAERRWLEAHLDTAAVARKAPEGPRAERGHADAATAPGPHP